MDRPEVFAAIELAAEEFFGTSKGAISETTRLMHFAGDPGGWFDFLSNLEEVTGVSLSDSNTDDFFAIEHSTVGDLIDLITSLQPAAS